MQNYSQPPRGSADREAMFDAMRPPAEWAVAAPLELVVRDMRVAGDIAFNNITAHRSRGAEINPATSAVVVRDGENPALVDGSHLQALLRKSGCMWVSLQYSVAATDAWYCADVFYKSPAPVLPEFCDRPTPCSGLADKDTLASRHANLPPVALPVAGCLRLLAV